MQSKEFLPCIGILKKPYCRMRFSLEKSLTEMAVWWQPTKPVPHGCWLSPLYKIWVMCPTCSTVCSQGSGDPLLEDWPWLSPMLTEKGSGSWTGRVYRKEVGLPLQHVEQIWCFCPVWQIHDILVWIRIRGSLPLTNGFGSWGCFHHWPFKIPTKN